VTKQLATPQAAQNFSNYFPRRVLLTNFAAYHTEVVLRLASDLHSSRKVLSTKFMFRVAAVARFTRKASRTLEGSVECQ
jgi:hypothetical protein